MFEYRQIIIRLRQGESARQIAKSGMASRWKVKTFREIAAQQGWLDPGAPLPEDLILAGILNPDRSTHPQDPWHEQVTQWANQGIQASTIHAKLIREHSFSGSYSKVQRFIKCLRNKPPETTMILDFAPGECAQVDFGAGPELVNAVTGEAVKTWFFVMVLAWSRHVYAEIVLHQDVETWLGCHRRAFEWFGGVVKKVVIDNPKCAITKACYYDPIVQRAYSEFAEGYGFMISACPPRDPKKKGRAEAGVKFVKKNFIPLRDFSRGLVDANQQLSAWSMEVGKRTHGTTREQPLTLFETERLLLIPLPERPPEILVWAKVKVHGDCHVMFRKCRYSAPWKLTGQTLWLRAGETSVQIYHDFELVASHLRLTKPGTRHTLNEHLPPNALAWCTKDVQWCLEQAGRIGPHCENVIRTLLADSVVDYLRTVQGIVGLQKKYDGVRLEAACYRALYFQSPYYRTIKTILESGMEHSPLPDERPSALTETYTGGGRFCRDTSTLLQ
jgi:transposase